MNCGCKIAFQDGDNPQQRIEGMRIEFCPLHEAVPEMLGALSYLLEELAKPADHTKNVPAAMRVARVVLAKAEGRD